jgi:hypothetical protein
MLVARPAAGVTAFEAAWLLRRFARGYDSLGIYEGEIVLVPRAPAEHLPGVCRRLATLLEGRCAFSVRPAAPGHAAGGGFVASY